MCVAAGPRMCVTERDLMLRETRGLERVAPLLLEKKSRISKPATYQELHVRALDLSKSKINLWQWRHASSSRREPDQLAFGDDAVGLARSPQVPPEESLVLSPVLRPPLRIGAAFQVDEVLL